MRYLVTAAVLLLLAAVALPAADAVLWDLLIHAEVINSPVKEGQGPVLSGQVTDHAAKPVMGAALHVTLGTSSVDIQSDENGEFFYSFENATLIPGTHAMNIAAALGEKKGFLGIKFEAEGDYAAFGHTKQLLTTDQATKYLNANPDDLGDDPLDMRLYEYYQNLQRQYFEDMRRQEAVRAQQEAIDAQKRAYAEYLKLDIGETSLHSGIYEGYQKDVFLSQIDDDVHDIVDAQLNHTLNRLDAAQAAMKRVLEEGGTREEARQAYIDAASTSHRTMEYLSTGNLPAEKEADGEEHGILQENPAANGTDAEAENITPDSAVQITAVPAPEGMTSVMVGESLLGLLIRDDILFVGIDGTVVTFKINGTTLVPVIPGPLDTSPSQGLNN